LSRNIQSKHVTAGNVGRIIDEKAKKKMFSAAG
jgi:hypothetical protein